MFELTAAIGDLSTPVKAGWTLWFAWGVVSLGWYRHARVATPVFLATPGRSISPPHTDTVMATHENDSLYNDRHETYHDPNGSSSAFQ